MRRANSGTFKKGHVPWHKGKKIGNAFGTGNQFKNGHRPHTWVPIGSKRLRGKYLQVKVSDTGIEKVGWINLHQKLWIEQNGEIPEKHVVVFKDGNVANIVIENLELISRAELMSRNTIQNLPKGVVECIRLTTKLRKKVDEKSASSK